MSSELMRFARDTDGSATVEWVVLTASLVGLALAVLAAIGSGMEVTSEHLDGELREDHTAPRFR